MRTLPFLALCALPALIPAVAVPAGPPRLDTAFGTGGLVYDHTMFSGLGEDGTQLDGLVALTGGRVAVLGAQRASMECFTPQVAVRAAGGGRDTGYGVPAGGMYQVADHVLRLPCTGGADGVASTNGVVVHRDGAVTVGVDGPADGLTGALEGPRLLSVSADGRSFRTVTATEALRPVAALPDGGVLALAGRSLVRVRADLTVDPAFRPSGSVGLPARVEDVFGVAVQGGRVYVAGAGRGSVVLWRFPLRAGVAPTLRTAVTGLSGVNARYARTGTLRVAADGRALVSFNVLGGSRTVVFARNGARDRAIARGALNGLLPYGSRFVWRRDGGLVVATPSTVARRTVVRLRSITRRGAWDTRFGTVTVRIPARTLYGMDVVEDTSGRLVVGAAAFNRYATDSGLVLARLR